MTSYPCLCCERTGYLQISPIIQILTTIIWYWATLTVSVVIGRLLSLHYRWFVFGYSLRLYSRSPNLDALWILLAFRASVYCRHRRAISCLNRHCALQLPLCVVHLWTSPAVSRLTRSYSFSSIPEKSLPHCRLYLAPCNQTVTPGILGRMTPLIHRVEECPC